MKTPRIALLPGDGVGPEVMASAQTVLDATGFEADYATAEIGWSHWKSEGNALPARTIDTLRSSDCALFGAITSKPTTEARAELAPHLQSMGLEYASPIVQMRQIFDLYAAIRPCRSTLGKPLVQDRPTDIVVFRENTEGLYSGLEWHPVSDSLAASLTAAAPTKALKARRLLESKPEDIAISTRIITRASAERIIRAAFKYASTHHRRRVSLFEKPSILRATGKLMSDVFVDVAARFPDIDADIMNIDAACMLMVTHPERFDVVVAENLFGDIASDLAAGLIGGLGFAPSANIGDGFSLFEPTHGSAPDIAGSGRANPVAMVLSAAMMLDWLGDRTRAAAIERGVARALKQGLIDTPDVAGPNARGTTESVTKTITLFVQEELNQ